MNRRKTVGIFTAIAGAALAVTGLIVTPGVASASNTSHTLVMNGVSYSSYKESGAAWHFNTPAGITPTSASVAERNQTWTGNGSDNLPCPYGIHWISNNNVLTISHCLSSTDTSSTSSAPSTTSAPSTSVAPSTTEHEGEECEDDHEGDDHEGDHCATTTTEAPTTTAAPTTTEAPTTLPPVTEPPTTQPPATDPPITTTTQAGSEGPTTTIAQTTTTAAASEGPTTTVSSNGGGLPRTGSSQSILVVLGLIMIVGGLLFIALTRRPDEA